MKKKTKKTSGADLSIRDILKVIMQEIADVRLELKTDFASLGNRVDGLSQKVTELQLDMKDFRLEMHQNQSTFVVHLENLDRRVTVLERR